MNTRSDLAWLSLLVRGKMGALTFSMTEDGNIGLFGYDGPALGTGDTAEEALSEAHENWHEPVCVEHTTCRCEALDEAGEDIHAYSSETETGTPNPNSGAPRGLGRDPQ